MVIAAEHPEVCAWVNATIRMYTCPMRTAFLTPETWVMGLGGGALRMWPDLMGTVVMNGIESLIRSNPRELVYLPLCEDIRRMCSLLTKGDHLLILDFSVSKIIKIFSVVHKLPSLWYLDTKDWWAKAEHIWNIHRNICDYPSIYTNKHPDFTFFL